MRQLVLKSGKYFFLFIFLITISVSCDKIQDSQVPNVHVDFPINLININELTIPGNSVFFPIEGYSGVIVYCELEDSYYAYDATCTYEISQICKIENEGVLGTCSCCGSEFFLLGGAYPASGPAAAPLKQYNVSRLNSFTLRVYN